MPKNADSVFATSKRKIEVLGLVALFGLDANSLGPADFGPVLK